MKREAIIEMTQQHTLYDLLNTAFAQMETDEFVDAIASYLFEREHSDAVMAIWRKDYADNDLPFPPTPSDQRAGEAPVQPVVGHFCPKCGSAAIGRLRLDCDWGSGGVWSMVNDNAAYSDDQLRTFDNNERPDVNCYVCLVCESCFDEPNPPDQGAAPAPLHPVVGCEPENGGS